MVHHSSDIYTRNWSTTSEEANTMNVFSISLVIFAYAVLGVMSYTGFPNQAQSHLGPVKSNYGYSMTNNQAFTPGNNGYTSGFAPGNNAYNVANANSGNKGYHGNTNHYLLPYLLNDGEMGGEMAAYSMMMNSNNNNMPLYYMMRNGEMNGLMRMLAFMKGNRGGVNPIAMSMMMGHDLGM